MRNLQSMFSPRDLEEVLSILDTSIREMCMNEWEDRNPPTGWGHCGLCQVKGDMMDIFFYFHCGIPVHPNCIDKNADPVNDARLTKWECPVCVRRASEKKGESSSTRKP